MSRPFDDTKQLRRRTTNSVASYQNQREAGGFIFIS